MSRAEKKAEKEAKKKASEQNKYGDSIQDAYDENGRTMTDEEAHRDVSYELPSVFKQIGECYMIQMKRFTKQKTVWFILILLIGLAIAPMIMKNIKELNLYWGANTNEFMVMTLIFLPLLGVLLSSVICGSMLPQEFNERTVYLSLPLPMERRAFYYGKFLSGFSLTAGTVAAAYGISILVAIALNMGDAFTKTIFQSLALSMCGVLFSCSLAYLLSTTSKRGSSMKPFAIIFIGLPLIGFLFSFLSMKLNIGLLLTIGGYMPTFSFDLAIQYLGSIPNFVSGTAISALGISQLFSLPSMLNFTIGSNFVVMCLLCIILSIAFLVLGEHKTQRRDM